MSRLGIIGVLCAVATAATAPLPALPARAAPVVEVVSSRADMVSEGSALIAVRPAGGKSAHVSVHVGKADVTSGFAPWGDGMLGLVRGLAPGLNEVTADVDGKVFHLKLINHEHGKPAISGPLQKPFLCETEHFRMPDGSHLGTPLDDNCDVPTQITYVYRPTGGSAFKPLPSPDAIPSDAATTTTTNGRTVKYVVRVETGVINRAIYQIAILFDPTTDLPPSPVSSPAGWNHKLVYEFGGSFSAGYRQGDHVGSLLSLLEDEKLSRGFALAGATLNVLGFTVNDALSAETASMVRERFIKTFGPPIYTMGWGGSGGAMMQHLVANNYPGLLDGIVPSASFPDLLSIVPGVDCALFAKFFDGAGKQWTENQKRAVVGYNVWETCLAWNATFSPHLLRPSQMRNEPFHLPDGDIETSNCANVIPKQVTFDPVRNRGGARCDVYSGIRNLLGIDPATGFAPRGFDNVGVQYGLAALRDEAISLEQFIRLNEGLGGFDREGNFQTARTAADRVALNRLYAYGRVNEGGNLGDIPIIDLRPDPGSVPNVHDSARSLSMRARLIRSNGNADNQIILRTDGHAAIAGSGAASGAVSTDLFAFLKMDLWLSQLKADARPFATQAQRVIADKPADLVDACFMAGSPPIREPQTEKNTGQCGRAMPYFSNPRLVAGAPLTDDILKCQLRPLQPSEYPGASAKQLARLRAIFPTGVCDYSKPGIGEAKLVAPWLAYPHPGKPVALSPDGSANRRLSPERQH